MSVSTISTSSATPTHNIHDMTSSTWIELDRAAFDHNVAGYKTIIGSHRILALVVKSNAYGHGLKEIATWSKYHPLIDWLCVSTLSEALLLRSWGITKPLLVLYTLDADLSYVITHNIAVMVDNITTLDNLEQAAQSRNMTCNVHIKIDTGMSRFGFLFRDIPELITKLRSYQYINIQGIYTHFADADNADLSYTQQQLTLFRTTVNHIRRQGITPLFTHCANSAATTSIDLSDMNFFRIGAGAYGLWPSQAVQQKTALMHPQFSLKQVIRWKTYIQSIKTVDPNSYVSYSLTYKTNKITRVALLPIGYYDGYHRRLSNTGIVRIDTSYAPVIGRIAMNTTCIDVTYIPHIQHGTIVTVLGDYPEISAFSLAQSIGSFNPREVTVRIPTHIPRIPS